MSTKTNVGLVDYCKSQLGNPYWYGTFGNTATASLYSAKKKQYPGYYTAKDFRSQYGKRVHDCVGLIKGYLWSDTPISTPKYNSGQDVSANGMLGKCLARGKIATIPELPGVLVFMKGHVGVYIGGGYVIEARGHAFGVVKTRLKDRPWTDWGKCPYISYTQSSALTGENKAYFPKSNYTGGSIVDALASIKVNGSFNNRKKIATTNGITPYLGTAKQNVKMLKLFKQGKLIKP
jgi:hypothetical protein